jgi:hypothetical protein
MFIVKDVSILNLDFFRLTCMSIQVVFVFVVCQ